MFSEVAGTRGNPAGWDWAWEPFFLTPTATQCGLRTLVTGPWQTLRASVETRFQGYGVAAVSSGMSSQAVHSPCYRESTSFTHGHIHLASCLQRDLHSGHTQQDQDRWEIKDKMSPWPQSDKHRSTLLFGTFLPQLHWPSLQKGRGPGGCWQQAPI